MSSHRPGPKRLTTSQNPRAIPPPLKTKARRSYNAQKKLQVLSYWATPSIPLTEGSAELRCPTIREVSQYFGGIPLGSISNWRDMEDELLKCEAGDRRRLMEGTIKWPELEGMSPPSPFPLLGAWLMVGVQLYQELLRRKGEGRVVRRGWFRTTCKERFRRLYPEKGNGEFMFSVSWLNNFLARHNMSIHRPRPNRVQKVVQAEEESKGS